MEDKIIIMGNAGLRVGVYETIIKKNLQKHMESILFDGCSNSTSTCSACDTTLTKESLLELINEMEGLLKSAPIKPFFPEKLYFDSNLITKKQIKFPRCHKKKWRVVKKFANNPKNFSFSPDDKIYYTKDFAVCHPVIGNALKKQISVRNPLGV